MARTGGSGDLTGRAGTIARNVKEHEKAMNRAPTTYEPLTPQRKQAFIDAVRRHGVLALAASEASQHTEHRGSKVSTFASEMRRDPAFDLAVREARALAFADIEREIRRRALEGIERPIVQGGHVVKGDDGKPLTERVFSDRLLEMYARSRLRGFEHKQTIEVSHQDQGGGVTITVEDLAFLPDHARRQFGEYLTLIREGRRKRDAVQGGQLQALPDPETDPGGYLESVGL